MVLPTVGEVNVVNHFTFDQLHQRVLRGDELLIEAYVRVAFVCDGRARPIPKPLRIAMRAEQDRAAG